jgi:sodium-coupled neutral amino acid transporter 7/8
LVPSHTSGAFTAPLVFTSVCVVVYTFGTTITFLIIIGDQFDRLLASVYGHTFCHFWYMNRDFTMTASSVLFILPFCYSKKIDFLRVPSAVGVFAIIYIVGLIAYEKVYGNFVPGEIKTSPSAWTDVFLVVPDICFGYQCHVSVIPIYSCMRHRGAIYQLLSIILKLRILLVLLCFNSALCSQS